MVAGGTVRRRNKQRFVPSLSLHRYADNRAGNCDIEVEGSLRSAASKLLSYAGARSTWKQTKAVENKIINIESEFEVDLEFPWGPKELNTFICACSEQGLKASTITSYVSQARKLHTLRGLDFKADNEAARLLMRGLKNQGQQKRRRVAVSPFLLRTLKLRLYTSGLPKEEALLIWCISLFLFFGAFRASEILSPAAQRFSDTTLLGKHAVWDLNGRQGWIKLTVQGPKEVSGREQVEVELLSLADKTLCPVEAWKMWRNYVDADAPLSPDLPLFSFKSGKLPTPTWLNNKIRWLLRNDVHYGSLQVLSHSFRAGLVSVLARLGISEEKIKVIGRWKSNAWKLYAKSGRMVRWTEMRHLAGLVLESSSKVTPVELVGEDECEVTW